MNISEREFFELSKEERENYELLHYLPTGVSEEEVYQTGAPIMEAVFTLKKRVFVASEFDYEVGIGAFIDPCSIKVFSTRDKAENFIVGKKSFIIREMRIY